MMSHVSGESLHVDLQGGADQADLYYVGTNQNGRASEGLTLLLGSGNDALSARYFYINGYTREGAPVEVIIDGGAGADRMLFDYLSGYMGLENPLQVITGTGNDLLAIIGGGYLDQLTVDLGPRLGPTDYLRC